MQPLNKKQLQNLNWTSLVLFAAGLGIGIILMSLVKPVEKDNTTGYDDTNNLIQQTDSLQYAFNNIQQINEHYASVLSDKNLDSAKLIMLDSLNILIINSQSGFLKTLDNLQIDNSTSNRNSSILLKKIAVAYRSVIATSDAINTTRNSFNLGNTNFSFDQKMLSNMQSELSLKELHVQDLMAKLTVKNAFSNKGNQVNYNDLLQQQDSIAENLLNAQKKRADNLIAYNNKLKSDNDKLSLAIQQLKNPKQQPVNKDDISSASAQNLNDQLSLVKADCYLSRADARQIISNSKQRKDLLQTALEILNPLLQSSNIAIKQQAQLKLNELKTIALNNHD